MHTSAAPTSGLRMLLLVLVLPLAALAQDTTGQKLDHAPGAW